MKFKAKIKEEKQTYYEVVYYWDIVFKNYKGDEILYTCVAPDRSRALLNFQRYMGCAKFDFVSCKTDGIGYALH